MFEVIKTSPQVLFQDLGRPSVQQWGYSQSGAADWHSFLWGNYLLGNPLDASQLEICLAGLTLRCHADTAIAVTGADLELQLNGKPHRHWQVLALKAGDVLSFKRRRSGMRAYLAVPGGFACQQWFASTAMQPKMGLGQALQVGQRLHFAAESRPIRQMPRQFIPDYLAVPTLRVSAGCHYDEFCVVSRMQLVNQTYTVSAQSDRMAVQLQGAPINVPAQQWVSEGVALGTIQVPPSGQPIVLLSDRQTLGGYGKIAQLWQRDCFLLSQLAPGQKLRLQWQPLPDARKTMQKFLQFFQQQGEGPR